MPIVDPKHPLATGLRSLWLPSLDAGESRLTNYARGEAETMAFPATVGERPAWAVGSVGPALDFDGINDYLSTTNLPWQPLTEGGNITVAVYAEVFAYPTSSTTELWSSQYAPGTADRVIATLGLRASSSTLRARINLNEPGGSSGGPSIAWPPLRTPFLAVFTSRSEFDHELATFAPGQGVPSFALDTTGRQPLASFNPTSEVIGNEIYAGATDAAFSGRIYGVWVWNRGFTRSDITSFLLDPFGLVAVPRLGAGISQAASFDAQAVSAGTLTTTWSLAAGAASSSAIATGKALSTAWSFVRGNATSPADGTAAGKSLATAWTVIGGGATSANPAGGKLLSTAWTVIPGAAASTATAAGAGTITTTWSVARGIAANVTPPRPLGGSGFGPGLSARDRAKIRNSMRRHLAEHEGEKFWPDPADLTPEELEEWARKAEAEIAAEAAPKGETPKQAAERIDREVAAFMEAQAKRDRDAILLLMSY
jgi:hypothetical protein